VYNVCTKRVVFTKPSIANCGTLPPQHANVHSVNVCSKAKCACSQHSSFYRVVTKYEKKISSFPGFSKAMNLLFHRLLQQKSKSNNDLHRGSFHINSSNITGHHRTLTMSYIVNSCFTQIFEWRTKNTLFVTIFPEVPQNSLSFPCSEKSLSIPGFPGLWPPCCIDKITIHDKSNKNSSTSTRKKVWNPRKLIYILQV